MYIHVCISLFYFFNSTLFLLFIFVEPVQLTSRRSPASQSEVPKKKYILIAYITILKADLLLLNYYCTEGI